MKNRDSLPTLTLKQKKVLEYVQACIQKDGVSPSHNELRKRFKLSSLSSVNHYMRTLEEKGYISRKKNTARSIKVQSREKLVTIPFAGFIAAGEPIEGIEQHEEVA